MIIRGWLHKLSAILNLDWLVGANSFLLVILINKEVILLYINRGVHQILHCPIPYVPCISWKVSSLTLFNDSICLSAWSGCLLLICWASFVTTAPHNLHLLFPKWKNNISCCKVVRCVSLCVALAVWLKCL